MDSRLSRDRRRSPARAAPADLVVAVDGEVPLVADLVVADLVVVVAVAHLVVLARFRPRPRPCRCTLDDDDGAEMMRPPAERFQRRPGDDSPPT